MQWALVCEVHTTGVYFWVDYVNRVDAKDKPTNKEVLDRVARQLTKETFTLLYKRDPHKTETLGTPYYINVPVLVNTASIRTVKVFDVAAD